MNSTPLLARWSLGAVPASRIPADYSGIPYLLLGLVLMAIWIPLVIYLVFVVSLGTDSADGNVLRDHT